MKRLAIISLMLVLLLNFCGYRLVIGLLQTNTEATVEQRVDAEQYSDSELISIKTTLNLPYYNSAAEFERAYGSITVDGQDYEYVKRRVYHDTLEVLCLPNVAKTKLQSLANDLTKAAADGQASAPVKKGASGLKISLPDFCQTLPANTFTLSLIDTKIFQPLAAHKLVAGFSTLQEQPPQAI